MENNNKPLVTIMSKIKEEELEARKEQIEKGELFVPAKETPKKKTYIVLYIGTDEDGKDIKSFEVIEGRKETFDFIKGIVEYIDIHESKVLTDNVSYSDAASIYDFMKYVSSIIEEDSFDIEDYNYGYDNSYDPESDEV